MKQITQTYKINSHIANVWQALVNPKLIDQWGGGPNIKMQAKEGSKFSLWGGDIHGTNTKIIENKLLEQDWFNGDWPEPSKVTFKLTSKGDGKTELKLIHTNVPDNELGDIDQGWKDYYLTPVKRLLESKIF